MPKGQKRIQQTAETRSAEQYQTGTDAAHRIENNPEVAARRALVQKRRGYIDAGKIGDAEDFVSNRAAIAQRAEQRDMRSNLASTGIAGLASNYADPTQVALADKTNKDEFARDSAATAEDDARKYISDTENMETGLINTELGADQSVMNSAWGSANSNLATAAQVAAARASIMPSILGAAIQGGAAIAAGGNWFQHGAGASQPCYIAIALYGEFDPRTLLLRKWLTTEVVKTFFGRIVVALYIQFGEYVAARVRSNRVVRRVFRSIFDQALVRARHWFQHGAGGAQG
jgi:hypothetical protein